MKQCYGIIQLLLIVLFLTGFSSILEAQTTAQDTALRQRLVWSGGENALRFQVVVERQEGGTYREHLAEFTTERFLNTSLQPGEYRFRIIPHDVLDRPVEASRWMNISIQPRQTTGTATVAAEAVQVFNIDNNSIEIESSTSVAIETPASTASANSNAGNNGFGFGNIVATFGFGTHSLDNSRILDTDLPGVVLEGIALNINILFIGRTGFTISFGTDVITSSKKTGSSIVPLIGFGYIYYDTFYIGGVINIAARPNLRYNRANNPENIFIGDVFWTPTLVFGWDMGSWVIGGDLSYMYGNISNISGFRFAVVVGVNVLSTVGR